jgi:hypothetical protein
MQKRQHTVPRCYLQNFSDEQGFVWVLDTKDKIFKIKPENILVENHFYTVTLRNGEKSLFVEDSLANIEGAYAAIFESKISKDLFLTDDERVKVSIFLAALMLRTKPRREGMRSMFQQLKGSMEEWKKQFETMSPEALRTAAAIPHSSGESISLDDVEGYLNNLEEEHSVSILTNLPETAQLIFNMKWSVWKNTDAGFVTCDDPLVLLRPASIKKYGPKAIGSQPGLVYKDVELTLPLSKDRLLLAGWILEQDSYLPVENEIAQNINHRTITHSSERVIAHSQTKVEAIKDRYTETAYKKATLSKN